MTDSMDEIYALIRANDIDALKQKYDRKTLAEALVKVYRDDTHISKVLEKQQDRLQWEMIFETPNERGRDNREKQELQDELERLQDDYRTLEDDNRELQNRVEELEDLLAERKHQGGRRDQYTPEQRRAVYDFYARGGETYRSTADHFGISTNTVGRFIKEFR